MRASAAMTIEARFSLRGRRALVTGSSRGIGRAIAGIFAEAGARLCLHGLGEEEFDGLPAHGVAVAADLSTRAGVDRVIEAVNDAFDGLDILVLNAAVQVSEPWHAVSGEAFARQLAVNVEAAYALVQAFVPGMAKRGWGRVIAIGSIQEAKEHPQMLVYAATKAAQASMVRNLARQLAGSGVTCNTLAPGVIETERNRTALANEAYRDSVRARIPASSFGTPEDCAGAALLLASDAGRYIAGVTLFVDGGMHL